MKPEVVHGEKRNIQPRVQTRGGEKASRVPPEQMEISRLRAEVARLKMERDIAKSGGVLRTGCAARYAWIHQMKDTYSVGMLCAGLDVSTSGYFHWLRRLHDGGCSTSTRCSDGAALVHIRAIHTEVKGEYGWPRMQRELQARGLRMGKERGRKLMAEHGIRARTKRKFVVTTDSKHRLPISPDLVQRHFTLDAPNRLWCGDITIENTI